MINPETRIHVRPSAQASLLRSLIAGVVTASMVGLASASPLATHAVAVSPTPATAPQYTLSLNGQPLYHVRRLVRHQESYLPIWYVASLLRRAGVPNRWTGSVWGIAIDGTLNMPKFQPASTTQKAIVVQDHILSRISSVKVGNFVYFSVPAITRALTSSQVAYTWDGSTLTVQSYTPTATGSGTNASGPTAGVGGSNSSSPNPSVPSTGSGQSTTAATPPMVYTFAETYAGKTISLPDLAAHASFIQDVATFNASVGSDGSVQGDPPTDIAALAKTSHWALQLTVANLDNQGFEKSLVDTLLNSPSDSALLAKNIAQTAETDHVSGINLDFEMIPATDRVAFNSFLATLYPLLHAQGQTLVVDVPAETGNAKAEAYDAAYNYHDISAHSDDLMVMAYDYSYPGGPAGPIAPVSWVDQVTAYAVSQAGANNVLLGIPTYAYDWVGSKTSALSLPATEQLRSAKNASEQWDATNQAPYFQYQDASGKHTVYYENVQSLKAKLQVAAKYHCAGIAFWRAGLESSDFWSLVSDYVSGNLN